MQRPSRNRERERDMFQERSLKSEREQKRSGKVMLERDMSELAASPRMGFVPRDPAGGFNDTGETHSYIIVILTCKLNMSWWM